ncbi:MAG: beta-ketoacyl-ACP reductase [Rickettsiales bacterium]|jgi:3-oxoacyl-[acyl-carrier protein] reductase|nr:beta-ketoacyl-ACP reductase [Rickettsiales bacterium]
MFNFLGKNVLITGATGGIGKALCKAFLDNGCNISLVGTSDEKLNNFINSELDASRCTAYSCDFMDKDAVKALAKRLTDSIDIVINNAGITRDNLSMLMSDEEWEDVIDVNLNSVFYLIKSLIRPMMKKRHGRIINITSIVGHSGNPGQANYCASKAAVLGMSKSLAIELSARNITVNCIAPGFIQTAMTDKLTQEQINGIVAGIPNGKLGSAADIASGALFLASDQASYITGQTLHINGGLYMA